MNYEFTTDRIYEIETALNDYSLHYEVQFENNSSAMFLLPYDSVEHNYWMGQIDEALEDLFQYELDGRYYIKSTREGIILDVTF
mgnify:CR=1 FL=1